MAEFIPREDGEKNIALMIILSIITCFIFNFYWNWVKMKVVNGFLGKDEYNFGLWFVFTLLTCGIYHIYHEYKMGQSLVDIQVRNNLKENKDLPIVGLIGALFGVAIVVDAIHQDEINKLYRASVKGPQL